MKQLDEVLQEVNEIMGGSDRVWVNQAR
jgi:hypothetical protein